LLLLSRYLKTSKLVIVICLFLFKNIYSQNLIQNGSFENYTNPIDCAAGGFDNNGVGIPVPHVLDNWYNFNSPDYFNSVCNAGGYSMPNSWFGYSQAKNGLAFVGFCGYAEIGNENKEYLYQQLSTPLVNGKIYQLSFYVTLADASNGAIKNIGAYFCSNLPNLTSFSYINVTPQIVNQSGFITDTLNWVQIQGLYNAVGGEQYVIIGNFNSNSNTDTVKVNTNSTNTTAYPRFSYYYIDDITLIDQSTVGVNELNKQASFEVYPNPNNGAMQLNYSITRKSEFILTDITGRIFNTYSLDEAQRSIVVNEHELNSGIYFYSVKQNNVVLKQDKIVIIK